MNNLLYTFNSKQISIDPAINQNQQPLPSQITFKNKPQSSAKNIRTKKIKRFEKIMDSIEPKNPLKHFQQHLLEIETIASQTLVRLSQFTPLIAPHSSKTIQQQSRYMKKQDIKISNQMYSFKPTQRMSMKNPNISKNEVKIDEESRYEQQIRPRRKRCFSLKDSPLVNYPVNDKKLPRAFRFKSIQLQASPSPKKLTTLEQICTEESARDTPRKQQGSARKIHFRVQKTPQSQGNQRSSRIMYRKQQLNAQQSIYPKTPAFKQF